MKIPKICLFIFLNVLFFQEITLAKDGIDSIRNRVIAELLKPVVDDTQVEILITTMNSDGSWPGINYEDVSRTGFEHRSHLSNMVLISRAYKKQSSKLHKNKKVKKAIETSLGFWVENDFICDNWWYKQIGTPNYLVAVMLIMDKDLPEDLVEKAQPMIGRAHLNASGARPSGDRIKIAGILAKNLLFIRDESQFDTVIEVIEGEIRFATERGMQYDYSFHHRHDRVNNTLSYGTGYADAFVEWAVYVSGTKYAFADEKLEQLTDYYLDGICKTMVFGKYPDAGAKNRSISRSGTLSPKSPKTAEKLLLTTDYRKDELEENVKVCNSHAKPTISHATFYWHSEHFTFQRPDFFVSVRMYSTRNHNMEEPYNSEGLLNHHRGDGANHISRTGDEYYDIAPVFDYQKVPGTTIMQKPQLPSEKEIQKPGLTDFVGAVTDGTYGAAAFDFSSPHDPLKARKAWFFFDEEYVCLGAGISCPQRLPVVTTLNQCLLRDEVVVMANNEKSILKNGVHDLKEVKWVFHDGVGYLFPEPVSANLNNKNVSGNWFDINKQMSTSRVEVSMDLFKLWLNHGEMPTDDTYQYIVIPSTTEAEMENNPANHNIEILANTPTVQAVKHADLNIYQIVFYKSGEIEISDGLVIKSDSPGIFMVKKEKGQITEISVSDPNRELRKMHFSVSSRIETDVEKSKEISIDLPQDVYAGQSVTIIVDKNLEMVQ